MFMTAYHTDIGQKRANQDALLIRTAKTPNGPVGLFVVCDGMGGLSSGELASATAVRALAHWFEQKLPDILAAPNPQQHIRQELETCVHKLNQTIVVYGEKAKVKLGTTLTALLVVSSQYYTVQIGDSRVYSIDTHVRQLTKDQTLVARELERGNITAEQAKSDPRRNVLLQCVGASAEIDVVISSGTLEHDAVYMLCTDGFYHQIADEELLTLRPAVSEQQLQDGIIRLIELVKERNETDNISAIVMKAGQVRGRAS